MIPCEKCKPITNNGLTIYPCGKSMIEIKRIIFALSVQDKYPYNPSLKKVAIRRINEANILKAECPGWKPGPWILKQQAIAKYEAQHLDFQTLKLIKQKV